MSRRGEILPVVQAPARLVAHLREAADDAWSRARRRSTPPQHDPPSPLPVPISPNATLRPSDASHRETMRRDAVLGQGRSPRRTPTRSRAGGTRPRTTPTTRPRTHRSRRRCATRSVGASWSSRSTTPSRASWRVPRAHGDRGPGMRRDRARTSSRPDRTRAGSGLHRGRDGVRARALAPEHVRARRLPVERAGDPRVRACRVRARRGLRAPFPDGNEVTFLRMARPADPRGVTGTPRLRCSSRYSLRRRNVSRSSAVSESTNWSRYAASTRIVTA